MANETGPKYKHHPGLVMIVFTLPDGEFKFAYFHEVPTAGTVSFDGVNYKIMPPHNPSFTPGAPPSSTKPNSARHFNFMLCPFDGESVLVPVIKLESLPAKVVK